MPYWFRALKKKYNDVIWQIEGDSRILIPPELIRGTLKSTDRAWERSHHRARDISPTASRDTASIYTIPSELDYSELDYS